MSKTFFVSTSIPYVNADPHLGHALEFVQADVLARSRRSRGEDVRFLTGTDENALKNVQAAEAAGVPVGEWIEQRADTFIQLLTGLSISNDDFVRTSADDRHRRGAAKLWKACEKDIYKKRYGGLYCLGCESFKTPKELIRGECVEHLGKKLETIEEENYFFRLSAYQERLEQLINSKTLNIVPESRRNETLSFIRGGLEDFSVSRSRLRAKGWGIEVPGDSAQIMYVWFDALSNYINALSYADDAEPFHRYWQKGDEIVHVIGKDINRFHTVYWPAMLLSAGLRLPSEVFVHGFITVEDQKMSKSLGNVVDPFALIEKYGADAVRYYLLREISSYEDGDFSYAKFEERYNADLANGLGNLVSRVFTLARSLGINDTNIRMGTNDANETDAKKQFAKRIEEAKRVIDKKISEFKFHEAISEIWELVRLGNVYVNEKKPWEKNQDLKLKTKNITDLVYLLREIGKLLEPFLPETSEKIIQAVNWEGNKPLVPKITPLFPRLN